MQLLQKKREEKTQEERKPRHRRLQFYWFTDYQQLFFLKKSESEKLQNVGVWFVSSKFYTENSWVPVQFLHLCQTEQEGLHGLET